MPDDEDELTETLVRVKSNYFTAGITFFGDTCITAAPILAWCKGKTRKELREYFQKAKWEAHIVKDLPIDSRVILTRQCLLSLSKEDRKRVEELFGVAMIRSIVGGNAEEFEGEWNISYAVAPETKASRRAKPKK